MKVMLNLNTSQGRRHHPSLVRQGHTDPSSKNTTLSLPPSPSPYPSLSAAVHSGRGLKMGCQSPITPLIFSDTPRCIQPPPLLSLSHTHTYMHTHRHHNHHHQLGLAVANGQRWYARSSLSTIGLTQPSVVRLSKRKDSCVSVCGRDGVPYLLSPAGAFAAASAR